MNPSEPLRDALRQLAAVVARMDDAAYLRVPEGAGGGIGSHVRHCLDHVQALLAWAEEGVVDYDRRRRGSVVETDRTAALAAIDRLEPALARLNGGMLGARVTVRSLLSAESPPVVMDSTLGRELAYVISHTTHHNALIGWLVRTGGGDVPDRFGYAAATLAWMEASRCAP